MKRILGFIPGWVWPAIIIFSVGTVWLRLHVVGLAYSLDQKNRELKALKQTREEMEIKVAGARSPRRLELLAKARFNLGHPQASQIIPQSVLPKPDPETVAAK